MDSIKPVEENIMDSINAGVFPPEQSSNLDISNTKKTQKFTIVLNTIILDSMRLQALLRSNTNTLHTLAVEVHRGIFLQLLEAAQILEALVTTISGNVLSSLAEKEIKLSEKLEQSE